MRASSCSAACAAAKTSTICGAEADNLATPLGERFDCLAGWSYTEALLLAVTHVTGDACRLWPAIKEPPVSRRHLAD